MEPFILRGVTTTGKQLGRRGAYGTVFEVMYCGTNYAAKEIHSMCNEESEVMVKELKDEFLRECCLRSKCLHPNIVQFIGIYHPMADNVNPRVTDRLVPSIPSMVTELMDCSLRILIKENTVPLHSALSILHDVSLAVWYLHTRNPPIIHCNLSPNIILVNTNSGVAKIAGFVSATEGTKGHIMMPGIPVFMPPEASSTEYGLPLDVFSYGGVALYTVVWEWPTLGPKTRKSVPLSEVERRQQYLDKMIGEVKVLRPLVEECLNDDPTRRPTIEVVSKRIKEIKKDYMDRHPITKLTKDELIQQKNQQLQEKDRQLQQQTQQILQKDQQLRQQEQEIQHKDQQIQQLQNADRPFWVVNRREISVSEKLLGTGGWGSVREGTFRGCKVAVKCIDNEIISPYNLRMFSREMNMAARCRHPNLMQFIAATDEGIPLIVTELMHTSLRKILQQGQLYSNQIIPILLGAACGLNYLHKTTPNPILHRDISSANVLLNPLPNNQWHAKLSDFGSANFMIVSNTVGAGNPSYAAPEALESEGPHTPAMDVFSFGVLMYEMCSREFPTDKPNPSMLNSVKWDVTESRLVGMICRCLSYEIQGRPSMDDLIFELNR